MLVAVGKGLASLLDVLQVLDSFLCLHLCFFRFLLFFVAVPLPVAFGASLMTRYEASMGYPDFRRDIIDYFF